MPLYKLEVFEPPERLRHRREIQASDEAEAIKRANEFYDSIANDVTLDRYVLYDGDRVVHERVEPRR
jgi:hypothetical protein